MSQTVRLLPLAALLLGGLSLPAPARAHQAPTPPDAAPAVTPSVFSVGALARTVTFAPDAAAAGLGGPPADKKPAYRACSGCPERHVLRPYLESIAINFLYNGINHLRGHPTANINFRSIRENLQAGFEWDDNAWRTNQFGHPYQGSNYFTAGRANGLTFWESSALAAFGSGTWEYFFENNRASLNDLINTTLGGIALGEVMHRSAWLVRDPTRSGRGRKEIFATIIDPMSGLSRWMTGDFDRVAEKPADEVPTEKSWRGGGGVFWQGTSLRQATSTASPYFEFDLHYGDARTGRSTTPFEAFTFEIAAGESLGDSVIRGRLFGRPFGKAGKGQVTIFQTFDFTINPAYAFGGQGFELEVGVARRLSAGSTLWAAATGGATVLAAVDTLLEPPDGGIPSDADDRRTYDYGPGPRAGGIAQVLWTRGGRASLSYQVYQVSVVDGSRATHVLQRAHFDARVPLTRQLALGFTAEYFFRKAYFWGAGSRTDESPQFRTFLTWSGQ